MARGGGERRSKRSKSNFIQHSNKAFSFFFDIKQDKLETSCCRMDEIMTKALTLGGEIVDEIEDADFIISNQFDEELASSGIGMVLSEKFIEESYSKGVWIGDVSSFVLSPSESLRKKQKKSKYSDEEIRNMMNFIYQHNDKSFDLVDEDIFERMAETPEFEGRSSLGLSRKFSQLGKNILKAFLNSKEDENKKNLPSTCESSSILDSLFNGSRIGVDNQAISEQTTPQQKGNETPCAPNNEIPQSSQLTTQATPIGTTQIDENLVLPEDPILKELKSELTKDQIFSFMCEIIGFPIIENKV
ncbi:predicted protein [Naegleria gruberi]|uniref:Predicted protein n=1 Tax=Naegleria gruberi TaxID=5762 RepID=D2VZ26_NAEGR|nr:uncharacterized protein NAEGRDRAFT_53395 [Naegleria gruberi]EFC37917.1 predicted protein [Naegleria gruberi]|eukprot:XP_002670661.1 predicted protein [Naegleria gruberi strain NEG-M]